MIVAERLLKLSMLQGLHVNEVLGSIILSDWPVCVVRNSRDKHRTLWHLYCQVMECARLVLRIRQTTPVRTRTRLLSPGPLFLPAVRADPKSGDIILSDTNPFESKLVCPCPNLTANAFPIVEYRAPMQTSSIVLSP